MKSPHQIYDLVNLIVVYLFMTIHTVRQNISSKPMSLFSLHHLNNLSLIPRSQATHFRFKLVHSIVFKACFPFSSSTR
jgi:hypothetical protein